MIYLLDVNLLIALLDSNHVHNSFAHRWIGKLKPRLQWATCPLTENAFIRITGKATYPNWLGSAATARNLLKQNCAQPGHHFWADTLSLCDDALWNRPDLLSSTHLTDCYLLALAVANGGKLASLDRSIPAHLVRGGPEALTLLPT